MTDEELKEECEKYAQGMRSSKINEKLSCYDLVKLYFCYDFLQEREREGGISEREQFVIDKCLDMIVDIYSRKTFEVEEFDRSKCCMFGTGRITPIFVPDSIQKEAYDLGCILDKTPKGW